MAAFDKMNTSYWQKLLQNFDQEKRHFNLVKSFRLHKKNKIRTIQRVFTWPRARRMFHPRRRRTENEKVENVWKRRSIWSKEDRKNGELEG